MEFLFSRLQDRMMCLVYLDLAGPVSFCDFRYGDYCKTAKVISVFCFIFSSLLSTLPESPSEGVFGIWSPLSGRIRDSRVSSVPGGPHPAWAPRHWGRPPVWGLCTEQRRSRGNSGSKAASQRNSFRPLGWNGRCAFSTPVIYRGIVLPCLLPAAAGTSGHLPSLPSGQNACVGVLRLREGWRAALQPSHSSIPAISQKETNN